MRAQELRRRRTHHAKAQVDRTQSLLVDKLRRRLWHLRLIHVQVEQGLPPGRHARMVVDVTESTTHRNRASAPRRRATDK